MNHWLALDKIFFFLELNFNFLVSPAKKRGNIWQENLKKQRGRKRKLFSRKKIAIILDLVFTKKAENNLINKKILPRNSGALFFFYFF